MPDAPAPRTLLVTGGAGFIGANLVGLLLESTRDEIVVLDLLTYAGRRSTLTAMEERAGRRVHFVKGDVADPGVVEEIFRDRRFDAVLHLAAETHVDRSLVDAAPFVRSNVVGTSVLLDAARRHGARFVHVGTDEVYGSAAEDDPPWTEDAPLRPRNPYSATKAAADLLTLAAHASFGQDVVITRAGNTYGPWQLPDKLIPLLIRRAFDRAPLPIYGDGLHRRSWLHVDDHARGILAALERGRSGLVYHLGPSDFDPTNLEVARWILDLCEAPHSLIEHVPDRPGHDRRYALDCTRARLELGWSPTVSFPAGLSALVDWTRAHAAR